MKILLASQNPGKKNEYQFLLNQFGIQMELPGSFECEETENTFLGNARLKAQVISNQCDDYVISDDSGLSVNALNGRPGVFSARYAGEDSSYEQKIKTLLYELEQTKNPDRTAFFSCALVFMKKGNILFETVEEFHGEIALEPIGSYGFGYDPIFYIPEFDKSLAQLPPEQKNKISHRSKALKSLVQFISNQFRETL